MNGVQSPQLPLTTAFPTAGHVEAGRAVSKKEGKWTAEAHMHKDGQNIIRRKRGKEKAAHKRNNVSIN